MNVFPRYCPLRPQDRGLINIEDFTDLGKFFVLALRLDVATFTTGKFPQESNADRG
jgi:hypothetical protein